MSPLRLNLIVLGAVVVIAGGFTLGLLRPGLRELDDRRAQLSAEVQQMRQRQEAVGNIGELYSSIVSMDELMQTFRKRLPTHQQVGEFLRDVSDALAKCGIKDYVVEPGMPHPVDENRIPADKQIVKGTVIIPVSLSFDCEFDSLASFLDRLEGLERLNHLAWMNVTNDTTVPGQVHVEVVIHAFHRPEGTMPRDTAVAAR